MINTNYTFDYDLKKFLSKIGCNAVTSGHVLLLLFSDIVCSEESCYTLSDSIKTWSDYVVSCPAGSTPVKITNQYEQDVVSGFSSSSPWIGKQSVIYFSLLRKTGGKVFLFISSLNSAFK